MKRPTGYVIYKGPSQLDGEPIVVIAIMKSDNIKTGNMVQTYVLVDNGLAPYANAKSGADVSICGNCKLRPLNEGICYVNLVQGPLVVQKAYLRGIYPNLVGSPMAIAELGRGREVRLGSYGDPAAVPPAVWRALISESAAHAGYTHQWANDDLPQASLQALTMASCDTPAERDAAQAKGWRTFTMRMADEPLAHRESACPASDEGGKKLQCSTCGACNGTGSGRRGSIAIVVHGNKLMGHLKNYAHFRATA